MAVRTTASTMAKAARATRLPTRSFLAGLAEGLAPSRSMGAMINQALSTSMCSGSGCRDTSFLPVGPTGITC